MLRDIIAVMLILYITFIRPRVPDIIVSLFDSRIFRIIVLALIVYISRQNMRFGVLTAIGFVVVISVIKEQLMYEGFIEGMEDIKKEPATSEKTTPVKLKTVKPAVKPKPTQTVKPKPTQTVKPKPQVKPTQTVKPKPQVKPTQTVKPKPTQTVKPKQVKTVKPTQTVKPKPKVEPTQTI